MSVSARLVRVFVLFAFFMAVLGPVIPHAAVAVPCGMMMTDVDQPFKGGGQPAKDAMPLCGQDTSCILSVAIPLSFNSTFTDVVWAKVRYNTGTDVLTGRSIPPDPYPPRSGA